MSKIGLCRNCCGKYQEAGGLCGTCGGIVDVCTPMAEPLGVSFSYPEKQTASVISLDRPTLRAILAVKIMASLLVDCSFEKFSHAAVDVTDNSNPDDPLLLQVVVQRKYGESPADKIGKLTAERDAATARADAAEHDLADAREAVRVLAHEIKWRSEFAAAKHKARETLDCTGLSAIGDSLSDAIAARDSNPIARAALEASKAPTTAGETTETTGGGA